MAGQPLPATDVVAVAAAALYTKLLTLFIYRATTILWHDFEWVESLDLFMGNSDSSCLIIIIPFLL
ncbi:hypothetical protein LguiB_001101 [Lonicera macranthoides]